jgi:AraC-like DNA-binding protein
MTSVRVPEPRAFATDAARDPVGEWEAYNAAALIALDCDAPSDRQFDAVEVNLQLPGVHLAKVRTTRHSVHRSGKLVATHPADAIAVYAGLSGASLFEQDGRRRVIQPGNLLICDADRPFLRGFGHGLEEFAVKVPRQAFAELTGRYSLDEPMVLDGLAGRDPLARSLVRLVDRSMQCAHPVPADEQAVLELVSVLATDGKVSTTVAHRAAARAYIEEHLADPGLSATEIAEGTGVSVRTLSRLFAEAGTSVPRHILGRRLDWAYGLLSNRPELRTVEVAARAGFTSTAHFSQAFLRRFGVHAGDVRRGESAESA